MPLPSLQGSLDEPTLCLVMHRTEPSQLQSLSLQLADKLYNVVENNDRILDQKPFFQRNMQARYKAQLLQVYPFKTTSIVVN